MYKRVKGNSPPPLNVPTNSTFNAYLINTNGLRPVNTKPLPEGSGPAKLNKIKLIKDLIVKWRLNAVQITETHDDNPVATGPLYGWHSTPSVPVGGKHGTATITADPPSASKADTNVSASLITWEQQPI